MTARWRGWSRAAYRLLIRAYPADFRARFADDLQADFATRLDERGPAAAWRWLASDLVRSLLSTHAYARAERRRARAPGYEGETAMGALSFDVRLAVRSLLKAPVFTTVTILTLALGIGANSAIFSLVNAVLLRPLEYRDAGRLMLIYEGIPEAKLTKLPMSPPDFLDLAGYQGSFTAIAAYRNQSFELSGSGEPEQITAARVSALVFTVLGVEPLLGRVFVESEDQPGQDVVVLSHALWQRRFAGDPAAVGRRVTLDRRPYTIIGVMPPTFQFPKRGPQFNGEPALLWTPIAFDPFDRQARGMQYNQSVVGRLRDGVTPDQAVADVRRLAPRVFQNYPTALRNAGFSITLTAVPLEEEIAGQVQRPLLVLLGAVGLVLLVGCANVANLVLSRAASREREVAVRCALGAGRRRLLQMLLIESAILALAGGALGLVIGHWTVRAMPAVIAVSLPGVQDVSLDVRVVAFALTLALGTAVLFGLVPLTAAWRRDLNDALREGATRSTGGVRHHRLRSGLVVSSVALAFVLLVSAGLLIRSFSKLMAVDPGIGSTEVATMQVTLPPAAYGRAANVRTFYREAHERLRAIAGVREAAIATDLPLKPDGERRAFTPELPAARGLPQTSAVTWIYGAYFRTFGIPVVRGRPFLPEEEAENRQVAIVSRALAERYWPGEDPIGKRLKWGVASSRAPWNTIVGVVGDVVDGSLREEPIVHIYVPFAEMPDQLLDAPVAGLARQMRLAALATGNADAIVPAMRSAVAALDPVLAVADITTMTQLVRDASAPQRFSTIVLGGFGVGALLLAAIGLYGVLAFGVAQRTREIGVRLALGASRQTVLALVVREGMLLTLVGVVLGAAGAVAATRVLEALLFEVDPLDGMTFVVVPPILAAVALLACYVPARRAAGVEPTVALRSE